MTDTRAGSLVPPAEPWALEPVELLEALGTAANGLSGDDVDRRLERFGRNELEEARGRGPLTILVDQFKSPLIYILLIAGVVTILLEEYIDAGVIALVLAINAIVGFTQEFRAERSMAALRQLSRARARVLRDGHEHELDAAELVPGDVILLETGDRVPADGRVLRLAALEIDESLLTGESVAVPKTRDALPTETAPAERVNSVYMGSVVTRGRGRVVVTATGYETALGRIAGTVSRIGETKTPLQRRMASFAHIIGAAILGACAVGFGLGLLQGEDLGQVLLAMVALAVAAIPEGLPIVLTVALAISVNRMARRQVIIRRLPPWRRSEAAPRSAPTRRARSPRTG
jgi:magnesium-transporting ATPase (P-type)